MRLLTLTLLPILAFGQVAAPKKDRHVVVFSIDGLPAYALDDPNLPMPTLRRLIKEGVSAQRMTIVNPTVTWPNHTTLVTGVRPGDHGVYYNGLLVRGDAPMAKVEPWVEKEKMVRAETVYDVAHRAGLTTAEVDWVAIHKAQTITWAFPEVPSPDGRVEQEMVAAGLYTKDDIAKASKMNIYRRDQMWMDAMIHILRTHQPNLALYHLLSLDSTHHSYGPKTNAGLADMAFVDAQLARLVAAIEASPLKGKTTLIVLSDHGFKAFTAQVQATAALKAAGLEGVEVIPEGGTAMVYVKKGVALEPVRKLLGGLEGVAKVLGPGEVSELQFPAADGVSPMPELVLVAKEGFAFAGAKSGPALTPMVEKRGSHGYPASDPEMDAIFVAWGAGVKPGAALGRIQNLDVAPTVAQLLGIRMKNTTGRALSAMLE